MLDAAETHAKPLPDVPDWTEKDKLAGEKELLGFWVTGHPLDRYTDKIAELATHDSQNLEGLNKGAEVAHLRRPHRHHAQAQQRRKAMGRDDARRPHRLRGSAGLRHQL